VRSLYRRFWKAYFCGKNFLVLTALNLGAALSRSRARLAAENLFLRKQLASFEEREKKARPTTCRTDRAMDLGPSGFVLVT
jgi:hypothetical protein